jgi:hypothetical protein
MLAVESQHSARCLMIDGRRVKAMEQSRKM